MERNVENRDKEFPNSFRLELRQKLKEFIESEPRAKKYNSLIIFMTSSTSYGKDVSDGYNVCLYNSNERTILKINKVFRHTPEVIKCSEFTLENIAKSDNEEDPTFMTFNIEQEYRNSPNTYEFRQIKLGISYNGNITKKDLINMYSSDCYYSTLCFTDEPYRSEFIGAEKILPTVKGMVEELKGIYKLNNTCNQVSPPTPQPPDVDGQGEWQNDTQSCSNTGQFGGGGTPLKDIKLFLYANKVTKGTITLSKPQVEVGTYATDWRPNPADATKSIEMMLKQIESVRKGGRKNGKKRD